MSSATGMGRRYAAEVIGTFGIVFAPVALAGAAHFPGGDAGLAALLFGPGHGAALTHSWVYVPGPTLGAVVAAGLYASLREVAETARVPGR